MLAQVPIACASSCSSVQPIHLEISPGNVQSGTLGAVEVDEVTPVHRRGSAIHDYNPMHTFMFDSDGRPLFANKAAVRGCLADPEGSGVFHMPATAQ